MYPFVLEDLAANVFYSAVSGYTYQEMRSAKIVAVVSGRVLTMLFE